MKIIKSLNYNIEIGSLLDSSLGELLSTTYKNAQKIILVDENSKAFCLEYLITSFEELAYAEVIELPSGEENKQLDICIQVWETMTEYNIDRNALLINLGGGVISDMGGFIASLYKRGISFINIPTTLLAMVDASIGGKTGVDLGIFKNQIGLFSSPKRIYIDKGFLNSLEKNQIKNGLAEMVKHGLIQDEKHWDKIKSSVIYDEKISNELIEKSISIKNTIVIVDPYEKTVRKNLNFGHTIGHAIESYFLKINNPILHGEAVAVGIQIESFISLKMNFLNPDVFGEIIGFIKDYFPRIEIPIDAIQSIVNLTKQDKKNSLGEIKMVLIKSIGEVVNDVPVDENLLIEGVKYYIDSNH